MTHITQVMGGIHPHVGMRTCRRASFPYFRNGWADCAEIWHVVRDPLARRPTKDKGGAQLHFRTCAPLVRVSGTVGRTALKCGVCLGDH